MRPGGHAAAIAVVATMLAAAIVWTLLNADDGGTEGDVAWTVARILALLLVVLVIVAAARAIGRWRR